MTGNVTFYANVGFAGKSITFISNASNQPQPLSVADQSSVTLEAIVSNANQLCSIPSFTGVKFDVWAIENCPNPKRLFLELYFVRGGSNLAWQAPLVVMNGLGRIPPIRPIS